MKKLVTICLVVFMLLISTQIAFAKVYVGGSIGLDFIYNDELAYSSESLINQIGYGAFLGYDFENGFSLNFNYSGNRFLLPYDESKLSINNLQLYAKYGFINYKILTFGVQLGASWDLMSTKEYCNTQNNNVLYLAAGLFANIEVTPELYLYADMKIPFVERAVSKSSCEGEIEEDNKYFGITKSFYYDAKIGFVYEIFENVFLGIEGSINTMTYYRQFDYFEDFDPEFEDMKANYKSINLNLLYRF